MARPRSGSSANSSRRCRGPTSAWCLASASHSGVVVMSIGATQSSSDSFPGRHPRPFRTSAPTAKGPLRVAPPRVSDGALTTQFGRARLRGRPPGRPVAGRPGPRATSGSSEVRHDDDRRGDRSRRGPTRRGRAGPGRRAVRSHPGRAPGHPGTADRATGPGSRRGFRGRAGDRHRGPQPARPRYGRVAPARGAPDRVPPPPRPGCRGAPSRRWPACSSSRARRPSRSTPPAGRPAC